MKVNKNYLIPAIIAFISFVIITIMIIILANNSFKELNIDTYTKELFYQTRGEKYGFVYYINRIITELGYTYAIFVLVIIVAIISKLKLPTLTFTFGAGIEYIINTIIKVICKRERPDLDNRWMDETSKSFPSGHSCCSACCYTLIAYLVFKYSNKKWQKILVAILSPLLIITIMLSRLVMGVHYLSDVFTGYFVGLFTASIVIIIHELLMSKKFDFLNPIIFKNKKEE